MISIIITNLDDSYYELEQEFQKLASLVPTIPNDRCLSELEFIEFIITYIRRLQQQLLPYDQMNEHIIQLPSFKKNSSLATILPPSSYLFNQLILQSARIQINESSSAIRRSPLATINLDNT